MAKMCTMCVNKYQVKKNQATKPIRFSLYAFYEDYIDYKSYMKDIITSSGPSENL